jgi:hypothetical protein
MPTATPAVSTTPAGANRLRSAIISSALIIGAVAVAILLLWQPWGERDLGYADIGISLGFATSILDITRRTGVSVPRWLSIGYLVLTIGVFALAGPTLNIVRP